MFYSCTRVATVYVKWLKRYFIQRLIL